MKKSLILALAASFVVSAAGTALAAPGDVKFDGNVTIQYREDNKPAAGASASGLRSTFTLNGNVEVAKNLDFYARYTYQTLQGNLTLAQADYAADRFNSAIDAYGFKYNNAGYNYVVGQQALTLGAGLIYDNGFIGRHALPYAATVNKKIGVVDTTVFYAKTNLQEGLDNDKFYGIQGTYAATDKLNLGALYTNVKYGTTNTYYATQTSQNFYELSADYQLAPKVSLSAAYAKSNASENNKAYVTSVGYKFDAKNAISAGYYRSEDQSNINDQNFGGLTTFPNANTKGYMFRYSHKIGKDASFSLVRDQYIVINPTALTGTGSDRQRTRATVSINF